MFDEIRFVEITRKYTDCPYSLGVPEKGFDCLSMLIDYCQAIGYSLPDEWHGWTRENYAERWNKGEGREELIEFLSKLGISINFNFMRKGDIVIFGQGPGIYLGNNHVITLFNDERIQGGKVFPITLIRDRIIDVRRLM